MNNMKQLFVILFIFLLFPLGLSTVSAESTQPSVEDTMLDNVSLTEVDQFWNELIQDYGGFIP